MSAHENGAPAKQLARETGLPLATAYHLLRTLVHDGYLRKLDDGGFILGDKLQTLHTDGPRAGAAQPGPSHARRAAGRTSRPPPTSPSTRTARSGSPRSSTAPGRPASTSGWDSRTRGTPPRWASPCCASWTTRPARTTSPGTTSPTSHRGHHQPAGTAPATRLLARGPGRHGPGGVRPRHGLRRRARLQRGHARLARRLAAGRTGSPGCEEIRERLIPTASRVTRGLSLTI